VNVTVRDGKMFKDQLNDTWTTSWSTPAATCVLRRWIEDCSHKGVALIDGTCT